MYLPTQFKEESVPALHAAIRQARIGTLVTLGEDGMEASHVPMLVDPEPTPYGTLRGHVSKGNPQWRRTKADVPALAMFLGPNAYITPSWYETKRQTGKVVPTWNYVAVHAYGTVRFFEDAEPLLDIVTRLTRTHESGRAAPWAVTDAPADFIRAQLKGIVGFELPIVRLEGKWKMSQNRPAEDRAGTIAGLTGEGPEAAAVAAIMATREKGSA
ncbi:MAG TPA: FMN-binding negative transcriptional regulator [Methylomirabilota bacterium]|nr:FMN-binding negative transcriptional regulator [Methylomirabilota bacterium]